MSALDALLDREPLRTCRGCGCDDDHACVVGGVACCWVLLDVDVPSGICSACAVKLGWDIAAMASIAPDEDGAFALADRPQLLRA